MPFQKGQPLTARQLQDLEDLARGNRVTVRGAHSIQDGNGVYVRRPNGSGGQEGEWYPIEVPAHVQSALDAFPLGVNSSEAFFGVVTDVVPPGATSPVGEPIGHFLKVKQADSVFSGGEFSFRVVGTEEVEVFVGLHWWRLFWEFKDGGGNLEDLTNEYVVQCTPVIYGGWKVVGLVFPTAYSY